MSQHPNKRGSGSDDNFKKNVGSKFNNLNNSSRRRNGDDEDDDERIPQSPRTAPTEICTDSLSTICNTTTLSLQRGDSISEMIHVANDIIRRYPILLSSTVSFLSFFFFIFSIFSFAAIFFLTLAIASSAFTAYIFYDQVTNHGIVSLLPRSILEMPLMSTSLDEYMRDTTFMMEHRYLFLYFIPRIDLDAALARLPERRREVLMRPLRVADLLGVPIPEEEEEETVHGSNVAPADMEWAEEAPRNEEAGDFDIAINLTPDDLAGGTPPQQMDSFARFIGVRNLPQVTLGENASPSAPAPSTPTRRSPQPPRDVVVPAAPPPTPEEQARQCEEEWEIEGQIINDAVNSMIDSTSNSVFVAIANFLGSYRSFYSRRALYTNFGIFFGFGALAFWDMREPRALTSRSGVRTTAWFGMGVSGGLIMARLGFQSVVGYMEGLCKNEEESENKEKLD